MPNEPIWLPVEIVVEHNRLELADTGEHPFVRDLGLLESALARPRNAFTYGEADIVVLAVMLMAGVSRALPLRARQQAYPIRCNAVVSARERVRHVV